MRICIIVLLLIAWPAAAQSIHKCADGAGGHRYQSQPCADGETLRTWTAELENAPTSPAQDSAAKPPAQRRAPTATRRSPTPRAPATRRDDQHARCLAARASRENALRKLGTQRRYDDLRRLNDRVSAVCNHRGRQ